VGITKTNAIPLGVKATQGGIFPVCSRFNHSCLANAAYSWNARSGEERVFAVKRIKLNEEITVTYLTEDIAYTSRDARQMRIKHKFGFVCQCQCCGAASDLVAKSDQHHTEIARLEMAF
jgi:hypothetical protein